MMWMCGFYCMRVEIDVDIRCRCVVGFVGWLISLGMSEL